ncbi:MAG: PEP-utilizing enzyme [Candidatus Competibacterales bacterium]
MESATLGDDPTPLLRAVGQAAGGRWDAAPGTGTPGAVDGAAWRRALPHPGKRWLARGLLALAAGRIRQREHLRLARTRVFARVRRVFLELGQRLTQRGLLPHPRAVFYLEVDEVLGAVEGTVTTRDLARLAAQRQAEVEAHAAADPLPPRLETRGPVLAALGERSQERVAPPEAPAGADLDARRGLGCSPGRVVAPVAVVVDPRRQTPRPGAVVVASATDPGWVPLLAVAGGLIVERGSPLSHAAIVAREMNLPAVVGVRDATRWLTDGEVVTLDGASGWVRRGNHG